jgi:spore germination protein KC
MKSRAKLLICLVLSLLLSGCWDQKELTEMAIVSAIGVDMDENGSLAGTFQIVSPSGVAGTLQGGAGGGTSVVTYTATGNNMVELSRRVSNQVSRSIFYSHANLLVIGEQLARNKDIAKILEALDRDIEFRKTAKVVIAHDSTAADLLKVTTPLDKVPANKVAKTLEFSEERWGETFPVEISEVIEALTTEGKEPVIPGFHVQGKVEEGKKDANIHMVDPDTVLKAAGIAVFKGGKLVDWQYDKEARGIIWLLEKIKKTNIAVDWEDEKDAISYQVLRANTKVAAKIKNGKPVILINISVQGDVGEVTVPISLKDLGVRIKIEKKAAKEIRDLIQHTVKSIQAEKTDVFGFGEKIYRSHPEKWKELEHGWNDIHFPALQVKVDVDASIVRSGLRNNPFTLQIKDGQK